MPTSNVFSEQPQQQAAPQATPEQAVTPPTDNVFSDQLKGITAEDGRQKYGTVEKALEALSHSQTLIPTLQQQVTALEQEKTQLREELAKTKGVQEVVDSLAAQQQQAQEVTPPAAQFGADDVVKILEQRSTATTQQGNAQKVNDALVSTFGSKAAETVANKAKELNTTPQALELLAKTSPEMVLALFNTKQPAAQITGSSFNFGHQQPQQELLKRPEKSLLSGAKSKDQMEFMKQIKAEVYAKHGITS
jgi:ribosomal protein L16 Arg81 hydroxylase